VIGIEDRVVVLLSCHPKEKFHAAIISSGRGSSAPPAPSGRSSTSSCRARRSAVNVILE